MDDDITIKNLALVNLSTVFNCGMTVIYGEQCNKSTAVIITGNVALTPGPGVKHALGAKIVLV